MRNVASLLILLLLVAACAPPKDPLPLTPQQDVATAPVVRQALPPTPTPTPVVPPAPPAARGGVPAPTPAPASVNVPAGVQYVCVADHAGTRQQTTIEFLPRVAELCQRHPEMGPCQYERNVCRRSGGRVFAANGIEITMQTEAEYDRKVMRVRFRAN